MNKIKKLIINKTAYNTIRIWMYFDESDSISIQNTKEFKLFHLLSIWNGYDKQDFGIYSWELPMSLSEYLKEKFERYDVCEVEL